jgi:hypothetical protein
MQISFNMSRGDYTMAGLYGGNLFRAIAKTGAGVVNSAPASTFYGKASMAQPRLDNAEHRSKAAL